MNHDHKRIDPLRHDHRGSKLQLTPIVLNCGHQDTSGGHQDGSYFYGDNVSHNAQGGRFYWTTFVILSLTPERAGLRILE